MRNLIDQLTTALAREEKIRFAYLFGSRARGDQTRIQSRRGAAPAMRQHWIRARDGLESCRDLISEQATCEDLTV